MINFNYIPKTDALKHQIEAINFIKENKTAALFDEQGMGKTKEVIDSMLYCLEKKEIDSVLIVCQKSLLGTWKKEVLKHSFLKSNIIAGNKRQRGRNFLHFAHFHVLNYETVTQEIEKLKLFLDLYKFAIVLDESQIIKNTKSKITNTILELAAFAERKIIITGTPIANKPVDIWSQYYFLDRGRTLGKDFNSFRKRFTIRLKGESSLEKYEEELSLLKKDINSNSIRRTKDILELPEKIYINKYLNLSTIQQKIYNKAKKDLYIEIKKTNEKLIINNIDNYLVKLLRLIQIASNPALIVEDYKETPAKFIIIDKLLRKIIKENKAIIWTSFRGNIRTLKKRYKEYGAVVIFGEIPISERDKIVDKFMEDEEVRVLIANPAAAKTGLTLTSANYAIYLDRNFKMDDYIQSQDRIHRIGQKRKCEIIKIIGRNTIDEYVDEILEKKYLIAQFALGDIDTVKSDKIFLTKEKLLEIIG